MTSDIKLTQLHKTCYAGASWEMSMQYPFMMVIKRSEPWWASLLEDDVMPHYYLPHLSLRQLCLPLVKQRHGLVPGSSRLLASNVNESINSHVSTSSVQETYSFGALLDKIISWMPVMWMDGGRWEEFGHQICPHCHRSADNVLQVIQTAHLEKKKTFFRQILWSTSQLDWTI